MSGPHPTISAWQRQEHEGYQAELFDRTLRVRWKPGTPDARGHFLWEAETEGKRKHADPERFEEIELAMAAAEHWAHLQAELDREAMPPGKPKPDAADG